MICDNLYDLWAKFIIRRRRTYLLLIQFDYTLYPTTNEHLAVVVEAHVYLAYPAVFKVVGPI